MRTNAQFSFAGRLVTIDYTFTLHSYHNKSELEQRGLVPVEIYPYAVVDAHVGYVHVDTEFGAVDLSEILGFVSKALADEPAEE